MRFALALVLVLAGCADTPRVLRDAKAPIASQVDVTSARLAGTWAVRVAWPGEPGLLPPFPGGEPKAHELRIVAQGNTLGLNGNRAVPDRDPIAIAPFETALAPLGQGRFRETGGTVLGGADLWVLWMDADNRTAAIGTPDGTFGWIMDRRSSGGDDRIRAAREIMEWRGYDLSLARERA